MLKAYRQAEAKAAKQRVKHHASEFKKSEQGKLGKEKFAVLVAETEKRPVDMKTFHYLYAQYWYQECPSCRTNGVAAGDEWLEEPADDQSEAEHGFHIVEHIYSPLRVSLPNLRLVVGRRHCCKRGWNF